MNKFKVIIGEELESHKQRISWSGLICSLNDISKSRMRVNYSFGIDNHLYGSYAMFESEKTGCNFILSPYARGVTSIPHHREIDDDVIIRNKAHSDRRYILSQILDFTLVFDKI